MTTTADKLLEDSLSRLAAKLDEFAVDYPAELRPICEAVKNIAEGGMETTDFKTNIRSLAQAVIDVRTKSGSPSRFRELPIPPYDLWLPFKADDLAPADTEDLDGVALIFNHRVSEMALAHGCSNTTNEDVHQSAC